MALSNALLLALILPLTTAITPARSPWPPTGSGNHLLTFNETVPSASFSASTRTVTWLHSEKDDQFVVEADGALLLCIASENSNRTFIPSDQVPAGFYDYWISSDGERVLWATNYTKQWRHSYFADYLIQNVSTGETAPLVPDQMGDIQYAEFAPTTGAIAFVRGNNLYLHEEGSATQLTFDGGPDLIHGVPDWVYEEEVLLDRSALWFSPDARYIAFLSFNEINVSTYELSSFMNNQRYPPSYPRNLALHYPTVGASNPLVQLYVVEVATNTVQNIPITEFEQRDQIIGEVAWVTEGHSSLIYRVFNRIQNADRHVLVDPVKRTSKIVRQQNASDGWIDNTLSIQYIGSMDPPKNLSTGSLWNTTAVNSTYYVDKSDESGWTHLYLYSVDGTISVQLTEGEWEVDSILKVDTERRLIYYTSTEHHSTERHVYSLNYVTGQKMALVDDTAAAYWSASFSNSGNHYVLSYQGPDVPYQEVYSVNSTSKPLYTLEGNNELISNLTKLALPNITYFELEHPDGYSLNVLERLPPSFNASRKYPVLFTPYGGTTVQTVNKAFESLTWTSYIASDPELEYVQYTVDNRGTGFKGRAFRTSVYQQIGRFEADDQIWAAEQLISNKSYIDPDHFGIWGWSFGGYLAGKVLEQDSGIFTFGLITSPITDLRLYDSVWTERYMGSPVANEGGYNQSAIRNATGLANAKGGVALMHGTSDDNVHYQNSAYLFDLLSSKGVGPTQMEMAVFTDSDHNIAYNRDTTWLYQFLTKKLWEEKERTVDLGEAAKAHQWE